MTDDLEGFAHFDRLVGDLMAQVAPSSRFRTLRALAREIQGTQRRRIAAQREPDGSAFAPRRRQPEPRPGNYALRFLYPKGAAEPRAVFLKSWVRQGPIITGYDTEAGAIRSFYWDRVAKFLPVEAGAQNRGAGRVTRRGRQRSAAMFRKLKLSRFLKAGATADEAWVGFSGRASAVARIHQEGGMDRPSSKARQIRYVRRRLLGLTPAERDRVLDLLTAAVFPASAT